MNLQECKNKFVNDFNNATLPDNIICTFTSNETTISNVNKGDSGGPLVITDGSNGGSASLLFMALQVLLEQVLVPQKYGSLMEVFLLM